MDSADVIKHINGFDMEALRDGLLEAPEPESGDTLQQIVDSTLEWVDSLRRDLITLVNQIGEGEDVDMAVAIQYVELKSRWIAFNTKMNYSMFKGVTPSTRDMCRAAGVSNFLGHLEPLLRTEDIDNITEFLARPVNQAA